MTADEMRALLDRQARDLRIIMGLVFGAALVVVIAVGVRYIS